MSEGCFMKAETIELKTKSMLWVRKEVKNVAEKRV